MTTTYRGFEIEQEGGVFTIRERGKIIDDAANEIAACDRVDKILIDRRLEDAQENERNFRRTTER